MNKAYKEVEELLRTPTEDGLITLKRSLLLSLLKEFDDLEEERLSEDY